ncbi:DUF3574 domain-containing protein [Solimonas variicoloris]|uniref:DUF3574 domain-containing protein n=1 Tax=Solimonas variicoloris TaxID=254408 RepID=UPI00036AE531|nr:DUF3574 domain-containing protein [Solimonas variicoloris]
MIRSGLVLVVALLLGGCLYGPGGPVPAAQPAPATASATLSGDTAHPAAAQGWVRTELYFGIGYADRPQPDVSEAQWRAFLDTEVTPRFPSGLSVLDLYGQWQGKGQPSPERLRSKLIVLLHEDTPAARAAIDAIRSAWKQKTGDQSVLRVMQPADVSF